MKSFKFTYRSAPGQKLKSDEATEATEKEEAIISFEENYPNLKYNAITEMI